MTYSQISALRKLLQLWSLMVLVSLDSYTIHVAAADSEIEVMMNKAGVTDVSKSQFLKIKAAIEKNKTAGNELTLENVTHNADNCEDVSQADFDRISRMVAGDSNDLTSTDVENADVENPDLTIDPLDQFQQIQRRVRGDNVNDDVRRNGCCSKVSTRGVVLIGFITFCFTALAITALLMLPTILDKANSDVNSNKDSNKGASSAFNTELVGNMTQSPTYLPTSAPTLAPTTLAPSYAPTYPTRLPTGTPTQSPTFAPDEMLDYNDMVNQVDNMSLERMGPKPFWKVIMNLQNLIWYYFDFCILLGGPVYRCLSLEVCGCKCKLLTTENPNYGKSVVKDKRIFHGSVQCAWFLFVIAGGIFSLVFMTIRTLDSASMLTAPIAQVENLPVKFTGNNVTYYHYDIFSSRQTFKFHCWMWLPNCAIFAILSGIILGGTDGWNFA